MRGELAGLPSPHPLVGTLPGIYQEKSFTERFCTALDDVLAPVLSTMDNMAAYFDVATTPDDMLPWLSVWLGVPADVPLPAERRRKVMLAAARMHGWQGTRRGVELAVESALGLRTVVTETGAADWSLDASAPLPGRPRPAMVVQVHVPPGGALDERRVDAVVDSVKPAHVRHRVEVVEAV